MNVFGYGLNTIICVAPALLRFLARPIRFNRRNRLHGVGTDNNAFRGEHYEHDHRGDENGHHPYQHPDRRAREPAKAHQAPA